MLSKLITEETYQFSDEALNWKEAITMAAEPLLRNGSITEQYIEKIFERAEEFGPFFDLGKGVAIPHTSPEHGVNKTGMSILITKEDVELLDLKDHPINIWILIASKDSEEHLVALQQLTEILMEDDDINLLKSSTSFMDINNLVN